MKVVGVGSAREAVLMIAVAAGSPRPAGLKTAEEGSPNLEKAPAAG